MKNTINIEKEVKRMAIEYTPQELLELIEDNEGNMVADLATQTLVFLGEDV